MKKTTALLFVIIASCMSLYAEKLKITLAYANTEFYPYQLANSDAINDPPGIAVEIIRTAIERCDMQVEFVRYPNKRVLNYLENNKIDGAFLFSYKKERLAMGVFPMKKGKIDYSKRITTSSYYLYKNKGSTIDWDGKNFKIGEKAVIGADSGYSIVGDLREKGITVEEANTSEQNLMKLKTGRIDAYAAQDNTTDFKLKGGEYGSIVKVPTPLVSKDYYLMLSSAFVNAHPKEADLIWRNIEKVRDEKIKELFIRYNK